MNIILQYNTWWSIIKTMKVTYDNIQTFLYTPGNYFVIPDFQRPYSWDKANITSFIDDLESVMMGSKNHYFGSIAYINEGNNSTIDMDTIF